MPTARELLEQADALMRRNRGGDGGIPVLTDAVPEEAAVSSRGPVTRDLVEPPTSDQVADARASREKAVREGNGGDDVGRKGDVQTAEPTATGQEGLATQAGADASANDTEPPLLTDVVDEIELVARPERPETSEGEPSLWLGADTIDPALHSITGPAPDTVGVVPPVTIRAPDARGESGAPTEESDPTAIRTLRAAGSEPTPPPTGSTPPDRSEAAAPEVEAPRDRSEAAAQEVEAPRDRSEAAEPEVEAPRDHREAAAQEVEAPRDRSEAAEPEVEARRAGEVNDDDRWRALAEQVSMQVLQRLDLFIDSGLKSQLTPHLQPIVARASAELVEAINDHVGQLVRTYVAEAIEREIAQWRRQQE
jgi:hypothetical protein